MRKIMLSDIRRMAKEANDCIWRKAESAGREPMIFLHWSAGHYGQPFADYHINIDANGDAYTAASGLDDILAHTWHHNSGSVGVAVLCCAFATTEDLGEEPPTTAQIEGLAQVVAILAEEIKIPVDYEHVRTHAEQANADGYGPATTCERWDLWFFPEVQKGEGGNTLRGKAKWYLEHGVYK